jgi:hypothetical protein
MKKINENSSLDLLQKNFEKEMILEIKSGYKLSQDYFTKLFDTFDSINILDDKKRFKHQLAERFLKKFSSHDQVLSNDVAKKRLERYQAVYIKFKGGALMYPSMLIRYMDRLNFPDNMPLTQPDTQNLTNYILSFPEELELNSFLEGLFRQLKRIIIPLRKREAKVLKILSNPNFLKYHEDGMIRTTLPTVEDLLKILKLDKKQEKTTQRAKKFIHSFNVCYFQNVIMNSTKFGFIYILVKEKISESLAKYKFWSFSYHETDYQILCIPQDDVDNYLRETDYLPLTNWYWNVNLTRYNPKKDIQKTGWEDYEIPSFLNQRSIVSDYIEWTLNEDELEELNTNQIEVIQKLSAIGVPGPESIGKLSTTMHPESIHRFLEKIGKKGVFQFYPNINFIGLEVLVGFHLNISDKNLFENIIQIMLSYPIVHIFTNEYEKVALGYLHLPRQCLADFMGTISDFRAMYPKETFLIHDLTKPFLNLRCLNHENIQFTYKNGIASEIE